MRSDLGEIYRDLRPYAFAIAYRMLGSVSEAEDVVQDAFVRLAQAGDERIRSRKAFVATVTTRLAIDELRSARARRGATPARGCLSRSPATRMMSPPRPRPRTRSRWPSSWSWKP